jgi:hypothetical protein
MKYSKPTKKPEKNRQDPGKIESDMSNNVRSKTWVPKNGRCYIITMIYHYLEEVEGTMKYWSPLSWICRFNSACEKRLTETVWDLLAIYPGCKMNHVHTH